MRVRIPAPETLFCPYVWEGFQRQIVVVPSIYSSDRLTPPAAGIRDERGDFENVCSHLPDDGLRDFVRWFYWTGMRPGEIRSLSWADFDKETYTIRLQASDAKTGFGRAIALVGELRAIIER